MARRTPGGEALGPTGTVELLFAVPKEDRWYSQPGKLYISQGFLDRIEVNGVAVATAGRSFGVTASAYVFGNLRQDRGRLLGDVVAVRWADGREVEQRLLVPGIEVQPEPPAGHTGSEQGEEIIKK